MIELTRRYGGYGYRRLAASLHEEFEAAKARVSALRAAGKVSEEVDFVIRVLFTLLSILIAVLLEKTTRKTSANSGLPPSQTDKDERRQER